MTFLDFFAGIGTIRIGFEQAGWTCNGHVEWDKYAQQSYKAMHDIKDGEYCGWDIRAVRADELPRSDLWTFGAPCQDFSVAGNRKGMDGERSSLVKEIFRLIRETEEDNRPTWLLYENVKGMLSSNGGWDFLGIVLEMDELGYDVEWQVLNSKDWGVPQNRERVFTLGNLRTRGRGKIFPIRAADEQTDSSIKVIGRLNLPGKDQINRIYSTDGLSPSLTTMQGGRQEPKIKVIGTTDQKRSTSADVFDIRGISPTLLSRDYKGPKQVSIPVYGLKTQNLEQFGTNFTKELSPTLLSGKFDASVAIPVSSPDYQTKNQNGRRFKEDSEPMFTLTAQDRHGVMVREATKKGYDIATPGDSVNLEHPDSETRRGRVGKGLANTLTTSCQQGVVVGGIYTNVSEKFQRGVLDGESRTIKANNHDAGVVLNSDNGFRIRKLTPKECWRLQGIPDHYFTKASAVNSDSQLYKQAGNACTVNVMYEIARRIK